MELAEDASGMADLVFPVSGRTLALDYAWPLQQALQAAWPWLAATPAAGVHPMRLATGAGEALLPARARLLLRLPQERLHDASALAGHTLDVQGHPLHLGVPHVRALQPHATLYCAAVASDDRQEEGFMSWVHATLLAWGLRVPPVCGRRHERQGPHGSLTTFSLMLHGLTPQESALVQVNGLGPHRMLGCGLFVGHKSAAPVGG